METCFVSLRDSDGLDSDKWDSFEKYILSRIAKDWGFEPNQWRHRVILPQSFG
jgi:hypothetical protein